MSGFYQEPITFLKKTKANMLIIPFIVMVLIIPKSQAASVMTKGNLPYPEIGPCNPTTLDMVKGLWALTGKQTNIAKRMEGHTYLTVFTTFGPMENVKCVQLSASNTNSIFMVKFYYFNISYKPGLLVYNITEDSPGLLKLNGGDVYMYFTSLDDNVLSYYVCSPGTTKNVSDLFGVAVDTKYINNPVSQTIANLLSTTLMNFFGKDVTAFITSGYECIFD